MAMFNVNDSSLSEYLNEADKSLKNEKKIHKTHGPEDYSKFSTDDLHKEFEQRANLAKRSKYRRDENNYTQGSEYGTHNRVKAANIGKELAKRGEKVKSPFYPKNDDTRELGYQKKSKDYIQKKPGSHTYRIEWGADPKYMADHQGSGGTKIENKQTKDVIKNHLKAKGKLREAAEYILSVLDEMEYTEN